MRIVGAIGDAAHWETMKFLEPGITENQVTAHIMQYLYSIPGMEDVEDVIVSSGPNTWPNWRNFSDRIIQPGDIVFMDLAALTWNGYKSCYYRTYCVGAEPSEKQQEIYATALDWLYKQSMRSNPAQQHAILPPFGPQRKRHGAMKKKIRLRRTCGATA